MISDGALIGIMKEATADDEYISVQPPTEDPPPLAVLQWGTYGGGLEAERWAADHPEAIGYIVITDDLEAYRCGRIGGAFYWVDDECANETSAIACMPRFFLAEERKRNHLLCDTVKRMTAENRQLRRQLKEALTGPTPGTEGAKRSGRWHTQEEQEP